MRILITGVCGFVGSTLAECLLERVEGLRVAGMDNLMRPGAETNRMRIERLGVEFVHGDLRSASDIAGLPACEWVIDAAANPSVLAGLSGAGSSRRLFEHNLAGFGNVLEYCREHKAGLLLLSSSRVYSIAALAAMPLRVRDQAFAVDPAAVLPRGLTVNGIGVDFSTAAPVSLYGATKLASEIMALEYGGAFDFPVWITRCGVLAGYQARDVFHPRDLAALMVAQMRAARSDGQRIYTAGGGPANTMSLAQLTAWCDERFGRHAPAADPEPRMYDVPWMVMDNTGVTADFGWQIEMSLPTILEGIAQHARHHPDWLEVSRV